MSDNKRNLQEMGIIVLLQRDLRLFDNPALYHALESNVPVIPVYLQEPNLGGASQWWRNQSFLALRRQLNHHHLPLLYFSGPIVTLIEKLQTYLDIKTLYWNDVHPSQRDSIININSISNQRFYPNLLFPPEKINHPFKIFAAFWRHCLKDETNQPLKPLPHPKFKTRHKNNAIAKIFELQTSTDPHFMLPLLRDPLWWGPMEKFWEVGEEAATQRWKKFKASGLEHYHLNRDNLEEYQSSLLSPHLHYGEISVRQIWQDLQLLQHPLEHLSTHKSLINSTSGIIKFSQELGWREFSYNLLYHNPQLQSQSLNRRFIHFPWKKTKKLLKAWQTGNTGYPIIDAAMRQLWQIGWMNNRLRMLVASFLTKNLLIPWQEGEQWFFDTLVDADSAINATNWQWVAGSGTDSAPYFRIFNPVLQGKKFDPNGNYIKQWIPELKNFNSKTIHEPWLNTGSSSSSSSSLSTPEMNSYPSPIIDLKQSREIALQNFYSLPK